MRGVWFFRLSRWGVAGLGLTLALWGVAAMFEGWDKIQIERGWSLFISGAVAVSGGVVTLAIAAALSRLDHALATLAPRVAVPAAAAEPPAPAPPPATATPAVASPPGFEAYAPKRFVAEEPVEVDRYENGGALYVMFSDGSVEIRDEGRVRRFASLSELRAQVGA